MLNEMNEIKKYPEESTKKIAIILEEINDRLNILEDKIENLKND